MEQKKVNKINAINKKQLKMQIMQILPSQIWSHQQIYDCNDEQQYLTT